METTGGEAVQLLSPTKVPIFSVNNVCWAVMVYIKQIPAHEDGLRIH